MELGVVRDDDDPLPAVLACQPQGLQEGPARFGVEALRLLPLCGRTSGLEVFSMRSRQLCIPMGDLGLWLPQSEA